MKITKEQYEALTTEQKKLYKKEGEEYVLVGDNEIASEMRRARDREKQRADAAEAKLAELEERLNKIEGDDARRNNDINALERSWQQKLDKQKAENDKLISNLKKHLEKAMVEAAIDGMAAEIFLKPQRDRRLLSDRVYIDYEGETPVVRVRDKDGKPSALTLADLKQETVDNKEFSDILVGSRGTGSGGAGGNQGNGVPKQPKDFTEAERIHLYKTNRTEFHKLFSLEQSA